MTNKFIRTDLAAEANIADISSISINEREEGITKVATVRITNEEESRAAGKPTGTYITVSFNKPWLNGDDDNDEISLVIANELRSLAEQAAPGFKSVLVAGLGNAQVTADAVGPECVKGMLITRHIKEYDFALFGSLGSMDVSAVTPGVVGQTGIETLELIIGAVKSVKPDLLVLVDALASRSVDRLATTVQLTDSGIEPGSGIGNRRRGISRETTGVPTIAVGVPTIVDSSTLVYDALERGNVTELSPELIAVLENGRSFFVSLKESDIATTELAAILSNAINSAFIV